MALAALLAETKQLHQKEVVLAHFNHGLRPAAETTADLEVIKSLANRYNLKLYVEQAKLTIVKNVEATARNARYSFLEEVAANYNGANITTAHTANDQLETVYLRFSSKAGLMGLKGIPVQRGIIIRPLLSVYKHELEDYLVKKQIVWHNDSTNNDTKYKRNRLRQTLPSFNQLDSNFNTALLNLAKRADEGETMLNYLVDEALSHLIVSENSFALPLSKFNQYPQVVQRQLLYTLFNKLMKGKVSPAFRLPEKFLQLNLTKQYPVLAQGFGVKIIKQKSLLIMAANP